MSSKSIVLAAAVAGVALLSFQPVHAANLGGKVVPGVCMLSREAVVAQSKVGKAARARLQQLAGQARDQLQKDREPLQKDIQAFQSKASSLSKAEREKQQNALEQRMKAFRSRAQELSERVQLTRSQVFHRISKDVDPVIASVYTRKGCGLLLDRDSVLGGNLSNDLTADVVAGLDKKISTIHFNLAPLPKSDNSK